MPQDDNPIIEIILADINAVIPNFTSLVSAYRLLVGSAEEIVRTPGVPTEIFQRAVLRYDRTGTLIDVFLELLCCKIAFASQFLGTVCAPIDLARYVTNTSEADDTPRRTAEQILIIELLRLVLSSVCQESPCFPPPPPDIGCPAAPPPYCPPPPPGKPLAPAKPTAPGVEDQDAQDLLSEVAPILVTDITDNIGLATSSTTPITPLTPITPREETPVKRKHYQKGTYINKKKKQL
jgi:hypothetical protein